MSKEIAKIGQSGNALQLLAQKLSVSPEGLEKTLRATAFKACKTNEQFIAAVVVANTYGLNPLLKEMTVFADKHGGVVPIVMVDGFVSMMNRNLDFDGLKLIENKGDNEPSGSGVESVTCWIFLKNRNHPVVITEYMAECYNGSKEPWRQWPRRMLRHKALIQGSRIAFGFSGIYDQDEAERIIEGQAVEVQTETVAPMIGLKGAAASPQKPAEASAEAPRGEEKPSAQGKTPAEQEKPAEAKFEPSTSDMDKTPEGTLKDEIGTMLLALAGGKAEDCPDLLYKYTAFENENGELVGGCRLLTKIGCTRKPGKKKCQLEVTHQKIKKAFADSLKGE